MPDELKNAIAASLPANVTPESLPEDVNQSVPSTETPAATPAQKVESAEVPFHEHPRWKEVMEEKRIAQERADRLERQLMDVSTRLSIPQQSQSDPDAGMTLEEKAFWAQVDARAKKIAQAEKEAAATQFQQEILTNRELVMNLMYERFQQRHPDIKSGSPEENAIGQRVAKGFSLEDAYILVMSPQKIRDAEDSARRKIEEDNKKKNQQKIAANLEGSGVSSASPIQSVKKQSVREIVEAHLALNKGG